MTKLYLHVRSCVVVLGFQTIVYTGAMRAGIVTTYFPRWAAVVYKCNTVKLLHSPLCPGGRGGVVSIDWCIYNTAYHMA